MPLKVITQTVSKTHTVLEDFRGHGQGLGNRGQGQGLANYSSKTRTFLKDNNTEFSRVAPESGHRTLLFTPIC